MFCAYAQKHLFDEIETIDILDANAGDHGHHFATNFNPEINIRESHRRVPPLGGRQIRRDRPNVNAPAFHLSAGSRHI